jgi:methylthioribose-1-phosphate isomerase
MARDAIATVEKIGSAQRVTANLAREVGGLLTSAARGERGSEAALPSRPPMPRPFEVRSDRIILLDQRAWPDIVQLECRHGADVARALRGRAVHGPVVGVIAAWGLALTSRLVESAPPAARRGAVAGAALLLRSACPDSGALDDAVRQVETAIAGAAEGGGEAEFRAAWTTSTAIAAVAVEAEERLAAIGSAALPQVPGRPIHVLTLGSTGALSGASRGTAIGILRAAKDSGRDVHVWLVRSTAGADGAPIVASELEAAGIPLTLVAGAATGALFRDQTIDLVLVGAERVSPVGDVTASLGTYTLAVLADRHHVQVWVATSSTTIASDATCDEAPESDRLAGPPGREAGAGGLHFAPRVDETPADLVSAFVTDRGIIAPRTITGLSGPVQEIRGQR